MLKSLIYGIFFVLIDQLSKWFIIEKIDPNGAMALLPVRPGDAIISIQNNSIKDVKDFEKKLKRQIQSRNKTILITIIDLQNTTRYIGVKIK